MQAQNGNHPQEELTKCGYKSQRKEFFFKESRYILATCWNLLSKYGYFRRKKKKKKSCEKFGALFIVFTKFLCMSCTWLFFWSLEVVKNSPKTMMNIR
jgi:hypothetical protein